MSNTDVYKELTNQDVCPERRRQGGTVSPYVMETYGLIYQQGHPLDE